MTSVLFRVYKEEMQLSEPISVSFHSDHLKNKAYPKWVFWSGRLHAIEKVGLKHSFYKGKTLYHAFSVITKTLFMKLIFNTQDLSWKIEEVEDAV